MVGANVEADEQNTDIQNVALISNMDAEAAPFVPIAVQQQTQNQIKVEVSWDMMKLRNLSNK